MRVLVNYASQAFAVSQARNTQTGLAVGGFDTAVPYSRADLDPTFQHQHRRLLAAPRGDGYWLWKPYVIQRTLATLRDGDVLFYSDAGAYFIGSIAPLVELGQRVGQDLMVFELEHVECHWTKRDAFVLTDTDTPAHTESRQRLASFSLWRKSAFTDAFCHEWLEYCQDERALSDDANALGEGNYPDFIAHRHDQSLFSLLTKRHGLRAFRDPSQWGNAARARYPECRYGQLIVHTRERDDGRPLRRVRARARRLLRDARAASARRRLLAPWRTELPITRAEWATSLAAPSAFYARCCRAFRELPAPLRHHRRYFADAGRGFGEDAFHVFWFLLFRELTPRLAIEIGVYRGQVLSLWSLLARQNGTSCETFGVSPFEAAGDSVSCYRDDIDCRADTQANLAAFGCEATLVRGYSTDAAATAAMTSRSWDLVYIDGSHDYDVVSSDWRRCHEAVRPGGVMVLDDAGLFTPYDPPAFAFAGHPGPSRLAQEIDRTRFREILQVGHLRAFQKLV